MSRDKSEDKDFFFFFLSVFNHPFLPAHRMEEVGLGAEGQEAETRLQTARPHAGVELLIEVKRREEQESGEEKGEGGIKHYQETQTGPQSPPATSAQRSACHH